MKKEKCAVRLNQALKLRGMKQSELSTYTHIPKSAISQYISGKFEPKQDRIEVIAKVLDVSEAWLMGYDVPISRDKLNTTSAYLIDREGKTNSIYDYENIEPMPKMRKIPLLGTIACGTPILAVENLDGEADIPDDIKADFALRCKGDSMIDANIYDGDIVYIKQQPVVNNGEIAAVLVGEEATLKRFYQKNDTVTLMPCNTALSPLIYTGSQLDEIRILGKAVYYLSRVK